MPNLSEKSSIYDKPQPPTKPLPSDCCGNGCCPCVFDYYYSELDNYQKALTQWEKEHLNKDKIID